MCNIEIKWNEVDKGLFTCEKMEIFTYLMRDKNWKSNSGKYKDMVGMSYQNNVEAGQPMQMGSKDICDTVFCQYFQLPQKKVLYPRKKQTYFQDLLIL